jgi:hypothetical protein
MRGLWRLGTAGLGMALLTGAATAQADAIPPPPACPPGSRGASSHAGQWCAPAPCARDGDCTQPETQCRPWRVCTRTYSVPRGGRRGFQSPPQDEDLVVASCAPEEACSGQDEPPPPTSGSPKADAARCKDGKYCVSAPLPPLPATTAKKRKTQVDEDEPDPPKGCCKCHLGARDGHQGWLLVLGLATLAARRGRR